MKSLLLAVGLAISLTGCYTMMYPPVSEAPYGYNSNGVITVPDSLAGRGVTIINQNNVILDRYYEDPFYRRDGFYGGSYYWDPYYYDYRGYNHNHRWRHGRYYDYNDDHGTIPGPVTPEPKKPRRQKDERRSENPPVDAPNQSESAALAPAPAVTTVAITPPLAPKQPDAPKKEAVKPADDKSAVKPDQPADSLTAKPVVDPPKEEKTTRRGNTRAR